MSLLRAAQKRRSRRAFLNTPLPAQLVADIEKMVNEINATYGSNLQLVFDNGRAFEGIARNYGLLSGVRNFIGIVCKTGDAVDEEKNGFAAELFVLKLEELGLNSCWIGLTYDKNMCPVNIGPDEELSCTIVFGQTKKLNFREWLVGKFLHRTTKTTREFFVTTEKNLPDWFLQGIECARIAPSTQNLQPVLFHYINGEVRADLLDGGSPVDVGIAKLHFCIGAGGGSFGFGSDGVYSEQGPVYSE